ncbi:MAG TPA: hypothetical protein VFM38_09730 [Candidatus Limnocylindrales bacterium]|nr:hypothetical protein [Candidatus Limnocylindrales bacterium]
MLIIERIRELALLPTLVKLGLVLMAFAGASDVIAHVGAASDGHLHAHTSSEAAAHLMGLVSMVVILLGVVIDGVRQGRKRQAVSRSARKESFDAVR